MGEGVVFLEQAQQYYKDAEENLEKKEFAEFMQNIGIASFLAAGNNFYSKILFLKVKGLFHFNQYIKVIESVPEALKINKEFEKQFKLRKFKGIALGHLGRLEEALSIFKDLLQFNIDSLLSVEVYNNIVWANLMLYILEKDNKNLREAKKYLDLSYNHFDSLPNEKKIKINNNHSVYYYYQKEYEKGIEILENTLQYCDEKDLAKIYNNLADFYLNLDEKAVVIKALKYIKKAEIIATKYNNNFELAKSFYSKGLAELREDQLFTALDTFYLALEFFKKSEAFSHAFDCLLKINEIVNNYKLDRLSSLKDSLKDKFKDTPLYEKI